jgi:hypothetical protein
MKTTAQTLPCIDIGDDNVLGPQETVPVTLIFADVSSAIQYNPLLFAGEGTP